MTQVRTYPRLSQDAKDIYDIIKYGHETYCSLLQWAVDNGLRSVMVVDPDVPDQNWVVGTPITPYDFSVHFSSPFTLTYSTTSVPSGLSFDEATGILSGTPTNAGGGSPNVSATDGITSVSVNYSYTIALTAQGIAEVGENTYEANGLFPGGTIIRILARLTDTQGDVETRQYTVTLPPGLHTGDVVVAVVAGEIDPEPHIQATASGNEITFAPAAPTYTLTTTVTI